jgi:FkbM family methyltransferase
MMEKVAAGAKFFLSPETWRVALGEARRGPRALGDPPAVEPLEDDPGAGLRKVAVGDHSYWLPSTMDWSGLVEIHREVFCPEHAHYYELGPCHVRPGDVVVDAGASEGFFARVALDRGARVIAVEPWKPMADALRRTFAAEAREGLFVVEETSLTDREGVATLHFDPSTPWGAHVSEAGRPGEAGAEVTLTTLDALIARSPWGRCDFLKMDIEGDERPAIAGARETLRRDRPCLAIAVYHHPTGYLDIRADLKAAGLGYRVEGKGLQRRRAGVYVPILLHAWDPGREAGSTT